jgi:ABC-type transport system involved in multi-copper enzyme maturation permease subunit
MMLILIVQSSKLLVLVGVSSSFVVTIVLVVTITLLPFLRQLSLYLEHAAELEQALSGAEAFVTTTRSAELHSTFMLSRVEVAVYVLLHAIVCLSQGNHLANMLLSYVLHGDMTASLYDQRVTYWQELMVILGVFLGFCGALLFVFNRSARHLRRY